MTGYFAVGNKCAVDFSRLNLPISSQEALSILWLKGFRVITVDLIKEARKCVGVSRYRRGAAFYQAPFTLDCSTLTKWVYARAGIWLPRHSLDQREMGKPVGLVQARAGDLIFMSGAADYWHYNPADGVGHVGICTDEDTIIHAANRKRNVVEDQLEDFIGDLKHFRGARRITTDSTITLESPSNRIVEWSGEFRNIIVQNLPGLDEA